MEPSHSYKLGYLRVWRNGGLGRVPPVVRVVMPVIPRVHREFVNYLSAEQVKVVELVRRLKLLTVNT